METKRLFFGLEAHAPWPEIFPQGRILQENQRHLTVAFLGNLEHSLLKKELLYFPTPPFKVGFAGQFDQCLFFPKQHPRVVAWHVEIFEKQSLLFLFFEQLSCWLQERGFFIDLKHPFTPHITLARFPFTKKNWENAFFPLPVVLTHIHLYESAGNLTYNSIWRFPIIAPFQEIAHTADSAFLICGENFDQLYYHAVCALAFHFPPILNGLKFITKIKNLDSVIIFLNDLITRVDQVTGCPYKAVSFHSQLQQKDHILHWEMIIDV